MLLQLIKRVETLEQLCRKWSLKQTGSVIVINI